MNQVLSISFNYIRYISQVMIFIALVWLIAPDGQLLYQNPEVKFFKPVQPSTIQVEVFKAKAQNFSIRDFYSEKVSTSFIYRSSLLLKFSLFITHRTSSERNPFYVHTTIHAP